LRADWRQEWEAELRYRERLLAEWDRLDWRNKLELLRRSASAFWDALVLQPLRACFKSSIKLVARASNGSLQCE
jgi:hypothetical protein